MLTHSPFQSQRARGWPMAMLSSLLVLLAVLAAEAGILAIRASDAQSGQELSGLKVHAMQQEAEGGLKQRKSGTTDGAVRLSLDLTGLGDGARYFPVGELQVSVVQGADGSPLPGYPVTAMEQLADGSELAVQQGLTDEKGVIRFDLKGLGADRKYFLRATSPVDGTFKRSAMLAINGDFRFVVGNVPLNVFLTHALTGEPLAQREVFVKRLNEDGSSEGIASGVTDAAGRVGFDLDPLPEGVQIAIVTTRYNGGTLITDPVEVSGEVHIGA